MNREELLRACIKQTYGSVLKLSKESGIPESSIRNIFSRGIDSVNAGTLVEICKRLNIDVEALMDGKLSVRPNSQKEEVWRLYADYKNGAKDNPFPESGQSINDGSERNLLHLYRELNPEGQEKLVDYADYLVISGKYIKNNPAGLVQEA